MEKENDMQRRKTANAKLSHEEETALGGSRTHTHTHTHTHIHTYMHTYIHTYIYIYPIVLKQQLLTLLVLNLGLHIFNGVAGLHLKGNCLTREGLDKDLHFRKLRG